MDYRELKEKKIYFVAPIAESKDDSKANEEITVAYVIAENPAEAYAKILAVDKSIVANDFTLSLTDVKDLVESLSSDDRKKEKEVKLPDGTTTKVPVHDGEPEFTHDYEAGKIYAATRGDGSIELFKVDSSNDIAAELHDPAVVKVDLYTSKAYLIDHVDQKALNAAMTNPSADDTNNDASEGQTDNH